MKRIIAEAGTCINSGFIAILITPSYYIDQGIVVLSICTLDTFLELNIQIPHLSDFFLSPNLQVKRFFFKLKCSKNQSTDWLKFITHKTYLSHNFTAGSPSFASMGSGYLETNLNILQKSFSNFP